MKLILLVGCLAVAALSACGCKQANKFVGTWEAQIAQLGQTGSMTQTIHPDGRFDGTMIFKIPTGEVTVSVEGEWASSDEKTLTLTQRKVTTTGLPKELEAMANTQLASGKDKPQSVTVTWSGNDQFVASGVQGAGPITFKRKK